MPGIKPGAAGSGSVYANHCAMPLAPTLVCLWLDFAVSWKVLAVRWQLE